MSVDDVVLTIPVLDQENCMVGIITVDDAIDVIQEEAEEDFQKMAAIAPTDKPYLKTSAFELWKNRIPWLVLLMLSATFTGMIISSFEDALSRLVILTAYIPMLMGTGGNSGAQASVTIIRALSLDELKLSDLPRVVWKEIRTAVMCGLALAVVCYVKIWLVDGLLLGNAAITPAINLVVCLALFATVLSAKVVGAVLPMGAKALKLDPAVMASPFITTIVDATSLLIYFTLASALLGL